MPHSCKHVRVTMYFAADTVRLDLQCLKARAVQGTQQVVQVNARAGVANSV